MSTDEERVAALHQEGVAARAAAAQGIAPFRNSRKAAELLQEANEIAKHMRQERPGA
jgi:hypothetical protein